MCACVNHRNDLLLQLANETKLSQAKCDTEKTIANPLSKYIQLTATAHNFNTLRATNGEHCHRLLLVHCSLLSFSLRFFFRCIFGLYSIFIAFHSTCSCSSALRTASHHSILLQNVRRRGEICDEGGGGGGWMDMFTFEFLLRHFRSTCEHSFLPCSSLRYFSFFSFNSAFDCLFVRRFVCWFTKMAENVVVDFLGP